MKKFLLLFWFLALPVQAQYKTLTIAPFKGLDLSTPALQLEDQALIQADNAWWLLNGGVQTRPGFANINSTSLGGTTPWLLDRIYYGSGNPSFIVGIGDHIWRMSDAGSFTDPDSILGYRTGTIDYTSGSNVVLGRNTFWAATIQTGDTLKSGANTWQVVKIINDTILQIHTTAGATATNQAYHILYSFTTSQTGGSAKVGENVIVGNEYHGAIVLRRGHDPILLGAVLDGEVDSLTGSSGTVWRIVDRKIGLTANQFNGYWIFVYTQANVKNQFCKINSNDAVSFTVDNAMMDTQYPMTSGDTANVKYWVFAPAFTFLDSGTVRRATKVAQDVTEFTDLKRSANDSLLWQDAVFEATTGKLAGQQYDVDFATFSGVAGPPDSVKIRLRSQTKVIGDFLAKGDKFILWQKGAASRHILWYSNQLVLGNNRFFPNQIRWSQPGTLHEFKGTNYRAVTDKLGNQLTALRDLNGDLAIWQEGDTWKIPGGNLSSGQLIHSLSGVGCPAPRSLAVSGSEAYWLTIQSGMPKIVTWGGGGLKFNVVGDPSVYAGGDLAPISQPIVPLMKGLNLANISKAAGGFWEDHYLLSVPESTSTVPSHTYCYHIPSGRWSRANFAGSIFYNATSAPDSGQLYFGNRHIGKINRFGGVETDTGSQILLTLTTKDLAYRSPIYGSQLGPFELDFEKANTAGISVQVFKNLPPTSATTLTFGSGVTGYRTDQKTPAGIWAKSFRLKLTYQAAQGIKLYGLRANYLTAGVP